MKLTADRPFADPEKAARRLMQHLLPIQKLKPFPVPGDLAGMAGIRNDLEVFHGSDKATLLLGEVPVSANGRLLESNRACTSSARCPFCFAPRLLSSAILAAFPGAKPAQRPAACHALRDQF